jgi:hypothetical protein
VIEVQWFFVQWFVDPMRKEPRNVGLLVRVGDAILASRFIGEKQTTIGKDDAPPVIVEKLPKWLAFEGGYGKLVKEIRNPIRKYGPKSMNWIPKKFRNPKYQVILGGANFTETVDIDAMWEELVL